MRGWTASALFTLAAGAATFGIYAVARWPFGWVQVAMLVFLGLLTALSACTSSSETYSDDAIAVEMPPFFAYSKSVGTRMWASSGGSPLKLMPCRSGVTPAWARVRSSNWL